MALKCGIVGLPNVGKSTLFNCLSNAKAQAANFPFCTIEPNIGTISIPDERLEKLEVLVKPERVVPTTMEIVDIAGLVKGASKGEGLGNQFLSNIRETDAIIHVLRCFEDPDITHVENNINGSIDNTFRFELDKYLNLGTYSVGTVSATYSFDYFSYFFERKASFDSGKIKKNVKKYRFIINFWHIRIVLNITNIFVGFFKL